MSNIFVIGTLEILALVACLWGLSEAWLDSPTFLMLFYNSTWFILGALTNIFGILSAYIAFKKSNGDPIFARDDEDDETKHWLHRHYLLAWLTMIIGYPTLISSFYMAYQDKHWSHAFAALSIFPLFSWASRVGPDHLITASTQVTVGALIPAQAWIAYTTKNWEALCAAGVMAINLAALSLPTRMHLWGLTPREVFIVGLGVCSFLFAQGLHSMAKHLNIVYCVNKD